MPRVFRFDSAWWRRVAFRAITAGVVSFGAAVGAAGAEDIRRGYDLPAGSAEQSLKLFSQQSGHGVIVGTDAVKEVRTNAVKGTLTAQQALAQLLAGTGLVATQDDKNGAFAIRPEGVGPNGQGAAPSTSDRPRK